MPLKELIQTIAKELVDHPDQVVVTEIAGEHNSLIELRVAKEDIGKVIGKEGRTAQSMRTILPRSRRSSAAARTSTSWIKAD